MTLAKMSNKLSLKQLLLIISFSDLFPTQNSGWSCSSDSCFKCRSWARLQSQNKIKTETKTQNLTTIASSSALDSFDYERVITLSPWRIERFNNDLHIVCMSLSICLSSRVTLVICCAPLFLLLSFCVLKLNVQHICKKIKLLLYINILKCLFTFWL